MISCLESYTDKWSYGKWDKVKWICELAIEYGNYIHNEGQESLHSGCQDTWFEDFCVTKMD